VRRKLRAHTMNSGFVGGRKFGGGERTKIGGGGGSQPKERDAGEGLVGYSRTRWGRAGAAERGKGNRASGGPLEERQTEARWTQRKEDSSSTKERRQRREEPVFGQTSNGAPTNTRTSCLKGGGLFLRTWTMAYGKFSLK